jgi:serine/threonine protein kinase/ABC-type transport system substrate-binding protein
MNSLHPDQIVQHYRIISKIGEGGMGQVYKAEDTRLARTVALKVLPSSTERDEKAKKRLLREARAASALNHPNIVTIHSIEETDGLAFIVMEYVEGETLKARIDSGKLEITDLIDLGAQLADALSAAHSAGFIHRDIKPSNILITPQGQSKILDFGLAKSALSIEDHQSVEMTISKLTQTGMIMGTVAYMSPEQVRGEPLDGRSDIFSLGCVLYEGAAGKPPFSTSNVVSSIHEITSVDPPPPSSIRNTVPQGLDEIIRRAMAKKREDRYSSSAELAKAIRGLTFANRYQIMRELGRGGMGVVYLAKDPMLERDVAIKVMTPDLLSADAIDRFKREARVVAKMDHPNIVGIHDIGDNNNSLFLVMPFVDGTNLRALLNEGSLSLGDVIDIGIQIAEALEYSHSKNVVHRDIKPENVLTSRPESLGGSIRIRVSDFGLAMATTESRITRTGSVVGTISYLSPEQLSGRAIDLRSDIYALGVVLYECIVGHPPFTGEIQSVLYRIAHDRPDPPRAVGSDIPEELENIVLHCLNKDPAGRPQRAQEVVDALVRHRSRLRDTERIQKLSVARSSTVVQRPAASPLIGREKEFGELQKRLTSASLQAECQFVLIAGESGLGKGRILEELESLARARKIRVLHSRFVEQDQALPYQGFCEVIQEYFHQKMSPGSSPGSTPGVVDFSDLAPDLVTLFPVLAEMSEITGGQKLNISIEARRIQDRTYIYDLLARSFVRIGDGKPLVVFFEDLQNADVSLDALQYIVRRLGPTPTLIVGTYRSTEVDKHHPLTRVLSSFQGDRKFAHLTLHPFNRQELVSFLEILIGSSDLEEAFVDQIFRATEGNPHFTKELIRSLFDSGRIVRTDTGSWSLSRETTISSELLPPTIQETVAKRIERLPEERREVLSIASVVGRSVDFKDLEILAEGVNNLEDMIDKLVMDGFLEEQRGSRGDQLDFSSGIVRDVLYSQVPRRKRRSLHRKYAEILEKRNAGRLDRVYSQLVHHYSEGDVPEKVIEFGLELVKKSLSAFSSEDALRAGRTVLEFVLGEDERDPLVEGEVRTLISEAHRMAGNIETSLQELESAVRAFERAKDSNRILGAVVLAAETAWERLKVDETRHWVEKGIMLARESKNAEVLTKLLSLGATVANLRGDYEKAKLLMEEAERAKPSILEHEEVVGPGGRLTVALPVPVALQHPANSTIAEETEILTNVFETLLSVDEHGHLIPGLCESWKVLEEGKSFQFVLREGIQTHDGSTLAAADVKQAFEESIQISKDTLPAAFAAIRGVSEYLAGSARGVSGISVKSEKMLIIELEEPLQIYPAFLTDCRAAVARNISGSDQRQWAGTGPFEIVEFSSGRVLLKRNEKYWSRSPSILDSIEFLCGINSVEIASGFRSGKIDLAGNLLLDDLDQILQDRKIRANLVEATKKNIHFVFFNAHTPLGSNEKLRQALCGVVRTDDLVRSTVGRFAQPADGFFPPGILGHDPGKRRKPLSRDEAVQLLKESGASLPITLEACIHPIMQEQYSTLTKELLKSWEEIGVKVNNATAELEAYRKLNKSAEGIDVYLGRWIADYDDPDNFTYALFHSRFGEFRNYFCSPEMDRAMDEARSDSNPAARERIYRKIENQLTDSGLLLPLFHEVDYRVAGSNVRKLALRSSLPYVNYSQIGKVEASAAIATRKEIGGILQIPISGTLRFLNPAYAGSAAETEVIPNIFESLTREAEGSRIVPWLASSFHAEEGGRRFRFRLRDDVRFHNGKRLTSRDVRYSFEQVFIHENSNSQWLLSTVSGAKDLMEGKSNVLRGFRIHSDLEFTVEMDEPMSFFPAILAYNAAAIIPEGLNDFRGNWRDGCVGTGPFRIVNFEPGRRLELEANPSYWRKGYPKSDGLVFSFNVPPQDVLAGLRAGRFAVASGLFPNDVETLRHDPELGHRYREAPQLSTYFLAFNIHSGPFADENLRHKLVQQIDVESLVRRNVGRLALPAYGLIPPGLLGHTPFRPRVAKSGAGSVHSIGVDLLLNSIFDGPYAQLKKELLSTLQEKGYRFRILDQRHELVPMEERKHADLLLSRWIADYPDADTFLHGLFYKGSDLGAVCGTPEMERLIERARAETRPDIRHDVYMEAEDMIARRALLLPLFHEQTYRFARPEVQDFELTFSTLQPVPYEKLWIRR